MNEAPTDLGDAGIQLWTAMHDALAEDKEFDERDLAILRLACQQADDAELLRQALIANGVIVTGSQGQPVMSSVVTELRNCRSTIARLLKQIDLDELTPQEKARLAARARWSRRPSNVTRVLPEAK